MAVVESSLKSLLFLIITVTTQAPEEDTTYTTTTGTTQAPEEDTTYTTTTGTTQAPEKDTTYTTTTDLTEKLDCLKIGCFIMCYYFKKQESPPA